MQKAGEMDAPKTPQDDERKEAAPAPPQDDDTVNEDKFTYNEGDLEIVHDPRTEKASA